MRCYESSVRLLLVTLLAAAAAAALAGGAAAQTAPNRGCQQLHPELAVEDRDAAFIGRVLDERRDASGAYLYRFSVVEALEGEDVLGAQVDVKATQRLSNGQLPLIRFRTLDVGVMLTLEGSTPTMGPCDLVPAVDLASAFDKPKGTGIMLAAGAVFLLCVLAYSMHRLRRNERRRQATRAGAAGAPGEAGPTGRTGS